jgi:hypothetical protein
MLSRLLQYLGLDYPVIAGAIPYTIIGPLLAWTLVDGPDVFVMLPPDGGPWTNVLPVTCFGMIHGSVTCSILIREQIARRFHALPEKARNALARCEDESASSSR